MDDTTDKTADKAPRFGDTLVLDLRQPIKVGEVTYTELHLSEPTVKQLREAEKAGSPIDQLATLVRLNAAVPAGVVDQIRQRDLGVAGAFFGHFGAQ